jgi:hypothetical protein
VAPDIDRGGRPFAPLQALLPVTRLKLWFDKAYVLSCTLTAAGSDHKGLQYKTLARLDEVLLENNDATEPGNSTPPVKEGDVAQESASRLKKNEQCSFFLNNLVCFLQATLLLSS